MNIGSRYGKTWEDFQINQVVSNINEYWEDMVRLGKIWEDFQINQVVSNINEHWEDMGRLGKISK